MNIKTCQYVEVSEVFKDFPSAWDLFCNSDPDCTWGDNNRTLVTKDVIINALENVVDDYEDDDYEDETGTEVKKVFDMLDQLEESVYVDLEN
jgi:hypothetical protein